MADAECYEKESLPAGEVSIGLSVAGCDHVQLGQWILRKKKFKLKLNIHKYGPLGFPECVVGREGDSPCEKHFLVINSCSVPLDHLDNKAT